MKIFITNLALFLSFIIVFSACSTAPQEPVSENNAAPPANTTAEKKGSEYPPVPQAIAQTEFDAMDGTTFKIGDRQGKVLLLNMWAIWCGPCRNEMPHLVEMEEKYKDKNFEIIGLNTGNEDYDLEDPEKIKEFAQEMNLNYQLVRIQPDDVNKFFKVSKEGGIPQSFLIDRAGNLRGIFVGGSKKVIDQMKQNVEKLVNE
ncbi:MAG TPA: TlpA disulfide reductase family protein [Pyrinomonadaceae bacterium]|nr:TlpA disulfide reductase family protein [Pyrinomonadaceae bacterium]